MSAETTYTIREFARVTTNITKYKTTKRAPEGNLGKRSHVQGTLWTRAWQVFQVLYPRASRLLTKGGAGRLLSFKDSQKVWN